MSLAGAVMVLIYGALAEINWRLAPVPNWAIILVALVAVFAIPACPPSTNAASGQAEKIKGEKGWAKRLIPIIIAFFCTSFAFGSVTHYINLYVTSNNMGGAAFTSICTSVQTVCAFGSCLLFGYLHEKLQTKVTIPAYCLVAVGIFLMYFVPVKPIAVFADGIIGIGWGILYTYWFFRSTVVVPHNMVGTATGVVTTANSLSYFPIPYVVTGAMAAMQTDNFRDILPLYGAIVAVAAVLSIIINLKKRRTVTVEHS